MDGGKEENCSSTSRRLPYKLKLYCPIITPCIVLLSLLLLSSLLLYLYIVSTQPSDKRLYAYVLCGTYCCTRFAVRVYKNSVFISQYIYYIIIILLCSLDDRTEKLLLRHAQCPHREHIKPYEIKYEMHQVRRNRTPNCIILSVILI